MAVIAVCSAKGSPGVTSTVLALGLIWPLDAGRRVLVVDGDPAGADIAAGYLQGHPVPGLHGFATSRTVEVGDAVTESAVALDATGDRLVLPGSTGPRPGLAQAWARLLQLSAGGGWDVIVDAGRADALDTGDVVVQADLMVLVVASSLRAVAAARPVASRLREARDTTATDGDSLLVVVVGERRPYPAEEVAAALDLPPLPSIVWDPGSATVLSDGGSASGRFARSALIRSTAVVARDLADWVRPRRSSCGDRVAVTAAPVGGSVTESVVESAAVSVAGRVAQARSAWSGDGRGDRTVGDARGRGGVS